MTEKNDFYRRQFLGSFTGFRWLRQACRKPVSHRKQPFSVAKGQNKPPKACLTRISLKNFRLNFFEAKLKTAAWNRCIKNYGTYLVFYFWEGNGKKGDYL